VSEAPSTPSGAAGASLFGSSRGRRADSGAMVQDVQDPPHPLPAGSLVGPAGQVVHLIQVFGQREELGGLVAVFDEDVILVDEGLDAVDLLGAEVVPLEARLVQLGEDGI